MINIKTVIHEIDRKENIKRIYFVHPNKEDSAANTHKEFKDFTKKITKLQYKANSRTNNHTFKVSKDSFVSHLIDSVLKNPPSWGSLVVNITK